MNTIRKVAQSVRQVRGALGLLAFFLLVLGITGCGLIGGIACEDIPVTVAPGTCAPVPTPTCFDTSIEVEFTIDNSQDLYSIVEGVDPNDPIQFCAAGNAPDTTERVEYMVPGLPGGFGRGAFVVTVKSLDVTVVDSPDPVSVGSDLTYTITVTNLRSSTVKDVSLLDELPSLAEAQLVSASAGCVAGALSNTLVCDVDDLAPSASATVTIVVRPRVAGTITNRVTAIKFSAPGIPDPTEVQILNTSETTVTPPIATQDADLAVFKSDSPDPILQNSRLTYMVTVTNNGPVTATGVLLKDKLPPIELDSSTILPSQGSCIRTNRPFEINCNFGTLTNGASATLTFSGFTGSPGTITNIAIVTANEPDPDTSNNTATADTTIRMP